MLTRVIIPPEQIRVVTLPFPPVSTSVLLAIWERGWELTETEREGMRGAGKSREGERGSMFNMTSKYLITSVTVSASQTRLPLSHVDQPRVSEPAPASSSALGCV